MIGLKKYRVVLKHDSNIEEVRDYLAFLEDQDYNKIRGLTEEHLAMIILKYSDLIEEIKDWTDDEHEVYR